MAQLKTFLVNIKTSIHDIITLDTLCSTETSVLSLKMIILKERNLDDISNISLKYNDITMDDNKSLKDYNIYDSKHIITLYFKVKQPNEAIKPGPQFVLNNDVGNTESLDPKYGLNNGLDNLSTIAHKGHVVARKALQIRGINVGSKIAKTSQGSIYSGSFTGHTTKIAIKRVNKNKYRKKLGYISNSRGVVHCNADIMKEYKILKYVYAPENEIKGLIEPYQIIDDGRNYFLIMKHGGYDLFNHVKYFHKCIESKETSLYEWKYHCNTLIQQMVDILDWLHNKKRVCHLNIGLENMTIKGCDFDNGMFTKHGQS